MDITREQETRNKSTQLEKSVRTVREENAVRDEERDGD